MTETHCTHNRPTWEHRFGDWETRGSPKSRVPGWGVPTEHHREADFQSCVYCGARRYRNVRDVYVDIKGEVLATMPPWPPGVPA